MKSSASIFPFFFSLFFFCKLEWTVHYFITFAQHRKESRQNSNIWIRLERPSSRGVSDVLSLSVIFCTPSLRGCFSAQCFDRVSYFLSTCPPSKALSSLIRSSYSKFGTAVLVGEAVTHAVRVGLATDGSTLGPVLLRYHGLTHFFLFSFFFIEANLSMALLPRQMPQ